MFIYDIHIHIYIYTYVYMVIYDIYSIYVHTYIHACMYVDKSGPEADRTFAYSDFQMSRLKLQAKGEGISLFGIVRLAPNEHDMPDVFWV